MFKKFDKRKLLAVICGGVLLAGYLGGFLKILLDDANVDLNPIHCMAAGWTSTKGRMWILFSILILLFLMALVIYRGRVNPLQDERGFELSTQGTYGTAGFMRDKELAEILRADKTMDGINGIIFGREIGTGNVLSLPVDSRLNRNIAVCGSQGSMKSRAFARVMALQCVRRGESMFITDPKSELYEDLCAYLKENGYVVKQFNLIQLIHSDAWNCLAEIDEGELIDVFCDVVIRNTTDKFDHFYDNVEMDLLKALCLYVYEEYPPEKRTFAEAYMLLLNKSVDIAGFHF